jgi:hypothetical protein
VKNTLKEEIGAQWHRRDNEFLAKNTLKEVCSKDKIPKQPLYAWKTWIGRVRGFKRHG